MNITLIHTKSETCRELFEFKVENGFIEYNSYSVSYRNDSSDIWGDEWQETHQPEIDALEAEIEHVYEETNDSDSREIADLRSEIMKNYWPTCCKTIRGETRCSGQSGGDMPEYPWAKTELKNLIIEKVTQEINKAKIY